MDLRKLKTLIDLVSESNIAELEITEAEGKVRIVKAGAGGPAGLAAGPMTYAVGAAPQAVAPAPAAPVAATAAAASADSAAATADAAAAAATDAKTIKSPMVGTFYLSSSPGAKPFVEVGSTIKQGETVCIVEAMKIMNEIESDLSGKIAKVLCENGQAVEFGQPLFVLE